ncbi:hypothetical protein DDB_G0271464 [Dictyostelium discoideum AX4]|uniref:Uncharacterized protein n=1 Tax=Dictyostelium discoideum TaxID=44689 RepID=Q55B23_DICDI|nr:hypothetical protein DDB_G0271464 [Dictyostelium discoideum AX4]EAL71862.1 hypothetical protein DDB_G0271464 [Dictyostelium discoideum AX4]|eukprot:XP_645789.1 hypothetical protein DDB_G0271464 [Dictyostelium discoideum AX4]
MAPCNNCSPDSSLPLLFLLVPLPPVVEVVMVCDKLEHLLRKMECLPYPFLFDCIWPSLFSSLNKMNLFHLHVVVCLIVISDNDGELSVRLPVLNESNQTLSPTLYES